MVSLRSQTITLELHYTEHNHRYIPKLSHDGQNWTRMKASDIDTLPGAHVDIFDEDIVPDTLWVAA